MHLLRHLLGPLILLALADALFHQPPYIPGQRQLLLLSHYASLLHPLFNNQPRFHENVDGHINYNGKYLRPSYFFIDNRNSQQDEVDAQSQVKNGLEYPDAQLRTNKQDNPQRFLFGGSTFTNPFWKTATYTSVSSLNITSVQNCIPAGIFVAGATSVSCRRKKREILLAEDALQFPTDPSKPQQVTVTLLPSVDPSMRDDRQLRTPIVSSIDEVIRNEEWQERQDVNKEKRFFHQYVATTTADSYVLSTYYSTKTIRPVVAGNQQLLCLPNGYVVCT